jgi:hypothetical protein
MPERELSRETGRGKGKGKEMSDGEAGVGGPALLRMMLRRGERGRLPGIERFVRWRKDIVAGR